LVFVNLDSEYGKTKTFSQAGGWKVTDKELADKLLASPDYKEITFPGDPHALVFRRVH
jgi:hypothetical protein